MIMKSGIGRLGMLVLFLAVMGRAIAAVPPIELGEPRFPYHLQGIACDGKAVYWSFSDRILKTDLQGKMLKEQPVAFHAGDLWFQNGRLYCTVARRVPGGIVNEIQIFDPELKLERSVKMPAEWIGIDGIAGDGRHFWVGRDPGQAAHAGLSICELDAEFRPVRTWAFNADRQYFYGTQAFCRIGDEFLIGTYPTDRKSTVVLSGEGKVRQNIDGFTVSVGVTPVPGYPGVVLVGKSLQKVDASGRKLSGARLHWYKWQDGKLQELAALPAVQQ